MANKTLIQLESAFSAVMLFIDANNVSSFVKEAEKIKHNYATLDWQNKMRQVERYIDSNNVEARNIVSSLSK